MRKILQFITAITSLTVIILSLSCTSQRRETINIPVPPQLVPDYSNITIPYNIAPLNFRIKDKGVSYLAKLTSQNGLVLEKSSRNGKIIFPIKKWRNFLKNCHGGFYTIEIFVKEKHKNIWKKYTPITNYVSSCPIDEHIVYRFIPTIHRLWALIEIYDRDITTFNSRCIIDNENFGRDGCINCHSFLKNSPDTMSIHIRSRRFGPPMLIGRNNTIKAYDLRTSDHPSPAAYHSWHLSGRFIALSKNKLSPFEHSAGETADVWDENSDLFIYDLEHESFLNTPQIAKPDRRETWPSWSADGQWLYFCSALQIPFEQFQNVRYDLMRVRFDPTNNTLGEPETLLAAETCGMSASHPRESPDGAWLFFTLAPYGNFPIYKNDADIYMLNLKTKEITKPLINSDACDSWFCWSSNGRWLAFASKRGNGLMARIYFSFFDNNGNFSKPFVLPQENPDFYESCTMTYNVPELITGPIRYSALSFRNAICSKIRRKPTTGAVQKEGESDSSIWRPSENR